MSGGALADHRPAVRMAAHHGRSVERVEHAADGRGITVEVAERLAARAVAR